MSADYLLEYYRAIDRRMNEAMLYHARRLDALMLGNWDFEQMYRYGNEFDPGDISGPRAPHDYGGAVADDDGCDC